MEKVRTVWVFPSSIVKQQAMKFILEAGEQSVIESENFIVWDEFKEICFSVESELRPVNSLMRDFFIDDLLRRNVEENFFTEIVPSDFSDNSMAYASVVSKILGEADDFLRQKDFSFISDKKFDDIKRVIDEYKLFLKNNELFDEQFEELEFNGEENVFYEILFPELILDFGEYFEVLSSIDCVSFKKFEIENVSKLFVFSSAVSETRFVLNSIRDNLKAGVSVDDIAITCASKDYHFLLKYFSKIYDVDLDFKDSSNLGDFYESSIFRNIFNVVENNFFYDDLRSLFCDKSLFWKNPDLIDSFIFAMSENNSISGKDVWLSSLNREHREFFKRVAGALEKIVESKSFSELKINLQAFLNNYFDDSLRSLDSRLIFQRTLDVLGELIELEKFFSSSDLMISKPMAFWLAQIDKTIYVLSGGTGVSVYNYRVGSGASFKFHYVMGINEESVSVKNLWFDFLTENEREAVKSPFSDKNIFNEDFSESYLRVYSSLDFLNGEVFRENGVGACKSNMEINNFNLEDFASVTLTGASNVLGKEVLAPRFIECESFQNDSRNCETVSPEFEILDETKNIENDFYYCCKGFDNLENIFNNFEYRDYKVFKIGEENLHLLDKIKENGLVRISATALALFFNHPFSYFLSRFLRLKEFKNRVTTVGNAEMGTFVHRVLERTFNEIKDSDLKFNSFNKEKIVNIMNSNLDYEFKLVEDLSFAIEMGEQACFPMPSKTEWNALRRKIQNLLDDFIVKYITVFGGFEVYACEKEYRYEVPNQNFLLSGIIDIVWKDISDDSLYILDYKTGKAPEKKDILVKKDNNEKNKTFQMPFYSLIVKNSENLDVKGASFYSFKEGFFKNILLEKSGDIEKSYSFSEKDCQNFGLPNKDIKGLFECLIAELIAEAKIMVDKIDMGDFSYDKNSHSRYSDFNSISRKSYNIK